MYIIHSRTPSASNDLQSPALLPSGEGEKEEYAILKSLALRERDLG
jgi:hypothetical protein